MCLNFYTLNGILVDEIIQKEKISGVALYDELNNLLICVERKIEKFLTYNLSKKYVQDLSMKGEDIAQFALSNELTIAFIVYKDNTLEIKYY